MQHDDIMTADKDGNLQDAETCLFLVDQLMIAHKEWVDKTSTETQRLTGCQQYVCNNRRQVECLQKQSQT